jgi:hypothetical protein
MFIKFDENAMLHEIQNNKHNTHLVINEISKAR